MTKSITYILIILTLFSSCLGPCETEQEWNVDIYTIKKQKCPDMVAAYYIEYSVYLDNERKGNSASRKDSCTFTWQAENDRFLTLDICNNKMFEKRPNKTSFNFKTIDSILIYSNEKKELKKLTSEKIKKFTSDWNISQIRGYSEKQFDSAFHFYPAYQYKITLFSESKKTEFYGYNYLILDSSNWVYEMSEFGDLEYFNGYWNE
ncbi:hypothetical protein [Winogradskyella alexanderae]|uniref:Lipoprotein n=1 Tax=Winogradskyella alexanderae TaxID=2877123 RepID=A0ABS7XV48_9FLAO|nr:hypothetical protein [Winogradskyella alexanderae]MCA0133888.1 hypothetical protein [Winogradskyella alexanderae]